MSQVTPSTPQEVPFEFRGSVSEYFGIWIVNILLIILTLGIYSAWAKVRTNRYFYGNTLLEDAPFAYLALPLTILKGWAIAVVALVVYSVITNFIPWTAIIFFILFLLALPWVVVRAMAFRARNSAHRNIRFTFNASYGEAAKVFIGLTLLLPLTLGLIYPYYVFAMNRFLVNHSGYGTTPFRLTASFGDFYKIFLKLSLMLLPVLLLLLAAMYPAYKEYAERVRAAEEIEQAMSQEAGEVYAPMEDQGAGTTAEDYSDYADAPSAGDDAYSVTEEAGAAAGEVLDPLPGDAAPYPDTTEYPQGNDGVPTEGETQGETAEQGSAYELEQPGGEGSVQIQNAPWLWAAFMIGAAAFFLGILYYLLVYAYITARVQNLVYNRTEFAGHRFRSSLRARDLLWLYFSNSAAIMLSLGLLIPWAKIRMARYRVSKLALLPAGDLNTFTQAEREKVSALGEEVGEVFDVDVGL